MGDTVSIDRGRLAGLIERERAAYAANFPGSRAAYAAAGEHLLGGVPMTWMRLWPGGFPLYQASARGARVTDIDGHEFTDFCLGDTGAMAGHSPAAVAGLFPHGRAAVIDNCGHMPWTEQPAAFREILDPFPR